MAVICAIGSAGVCMFTREGLPRKDRRMLADNEAPKTVDDVAKELRERSDGIVAMYLDGKTLAQVGSAFGVSRERVRQLLGKAGVQSVDGGRAKRTKQRTQAKEDKKLAADIAWLAENGMSKADMKATGLRKAYVKQRASSAHRHIEWQLTFAEWFSVWADSGMIDQRGQGAKRYCMARHGDVGPYAIGNVKIITNAENSKECRALDKVRASMNAAAARELRQLVEK